MITDYKLIQADGNQELAAEVRWLIKDGWEPLGAPIKVSEWDGIDGVCTPGCLFAQVLVKRESESAELRRLRDIERDVDRIVTELENPCADEASMLAFTHESLVKALRGGKWERK